ncbi:hypothetical protein A2Z00_00420 [Candidatus Gottesmanbacteria bacterium RBG_13_45_10]|uniref:Uncharacterized protein n=1 Tax=Candidatus Gottesmanbacteria bacterium RBG_13_45_10 TaxID=1798370 RepID=A0A1F5ZFV6_9BACT|nr:MAG: hypothetical protein A2Z00_00420 [Candidatus Gottesmanbacteria bacterium RBG_13_45_10]
MITDADIKKLKAVFATKDDLTAMERRFNAKFATKDDLNRFATKDDLNRFATKDDLAAMEKRLKKEIVGDLVGYMGHTILPILNEHEKRLDRLEKHVGGFPPLA